MQSFFFSLHFFSKCFAKFHRCPLQTRVCHWWFISLFATHFIVVHRSDAKLDNVQLFPRISGPGRGCLWSWIDQQGVWFGVSLFISFFSRVCSHLLVSEWSIHHFPPVLRWHKNGRENRFKTTFVSEFGASILFARCIAMRGYKRARNIGS